MPKTKADLVFITLQINKFDIIIKIDKKKEQPSSYTYLPNDYKEDYFSIIYLHAITT